MRQRGRMIRLIALGTGLAVVIAACGSGKKAPSTSASAKSGATASVVMGTTDRVVALDPAGSYDLGSWTPIYNIYQLLLKIPPGGNTPVPDAATCAWQNPSNPVVYMCTMKAGQKFSNGDPVTAQDAAYSFQRIVTIKASNGPSSLLSSMKSVTASGNTVTFTLTAPNAVWPYVLTTGAGALVDQKVFPADKLLPDSQVIGSGPYKLAKYVPNQLAEFLPNPNYGGDDKLSNKEFIIRYEQNADTLVSDVSSGAINVAYRDMSPTQIKSLQGKSGVQIVYGHGTEIRYLNFNYNVMPGSNTAQKSAIRQAIAYLINRQDIATNVYNNTVKPLYSMIPQGLAGHTDSFKQMYGASPNPAKAKAALQAAGVQTPLAITLWYNTNHYGEASADEYTEIQRQLGASGLFKVTLQSAEWSTYNVAITKDEYGIGQLGWFPDYPNADDYTAPFYIDCSAATPNFPNNHYCNPAMEKLIAQEEATTDQAKRNAIFAQIQTIAAQDPVYIPVWQGGQVAAVGSNVTGVPSTFDPSYTFRFWLIGKK